ncbi:MAG: CDP-alcohol phosphatidyltransferase family protein [bacterium]|nr:CDP-alcohol phosphatidyltransferase family protein [bacterium]
MLNVPNLLTLLRLIAIPVFLILLMDFRWAEALGVFVAAGVTDALDGAIARLTHTKTTLGAYLDPAADKLLLMAAFLALGFMQEVPRWLVVIVISRDVILVLGYFLLFVMTQSAMEVRPSVAGKLSTFFQLSTVAVVLLGRVAPAAVPAWAELALCWTTGVVTAVAGLQYMARGLLWLQGHDEPAA